MHRAIAPNLPTSWRCSVPRSYMFARIRTGCFSWGDWGRRRNGEAPPRGRIRGGGHLHSRVPASGGSKGAGAGAGAGASRSSPGPSSIAPPVPCQLGKLPLAHSAPQPSSRAGTSLSRRRTPARARNNSKSCRHPPAHRDTGDTGSRCCSRTRCARSASCRPSGSTRTAGVRAGFVEKERPLAWPRLCRASSSQREPPGRASGARRYSATPSARKRPKRPIYRTGGAFAEYSIAPSSRRGLLPKI